MRRSGLAVKTKKIDTQLTIAKVEESLSLLHKEAKKTISSIKDKYSKRDRPHRTLVDANLKPFIFAKV